MDDPAVRDEYIIENLEALKALSHSRRVELMRLFRQPRTVKQVAALINKPPTALYYHVNLLEEHGLLVVTDTNLVSGIVEKTYRAAARRFRIADDLLSGGGQPDETIQAMLDMMFTTTRRELRQTLLAQHDLDKVSKNCLARVQFHLTQVQAQSFNRELMTLIEAYDAFTEPRPNVATAAYNFTALFFPVVQTSNTPIQTGEDS